MTTTRPALMRMRDDHSALPDCSPSRVVPAHSAQQSALPTAVHTECAIFIACRCKVLDVHNFIRALNNPPSDVDCAVGHSALGCRQQPSATVLEFFAVRLELALIHCERRSGCHARIGLAWMTRGKVSHPDGRPVVILVHETMRLRVAVVQLVLRHAVGGRLPSTPVLSPPNPAVCMPGGSRSLASTAVGTADRPLPVHSRSSPS